MLPEKGAGVNSMAGSPVPMDTVYSAGEVDNWLSENGLESLQGYVRTAGMYAPFIMSVIGSCESDCAEAELCGIPSLSIKELCKRTDNVLRQSLAVSSDSTHSKIRGEGEILGQL